jgi:hypothetical protein
MPSFEDSDSPDAPLSDPMNGLILAMCRDCAELDDQLNIG